MQKRTREDMSAGRPAAAKRAVWSSVYHQYCGYLGPVGWRACHGSWQVMFLSDRQIDTGLVMAAGQFRLKNSTLYIQMNHGQHNGMIVAVAFYALSVILSRLR